MHPVPTPALASKSERASYSKNVLNQIKDTLDTLRPYFEDPEINEIMVNGPDDVFISKHGKERRVRVALTAGTIRTAITLMASFVAKEVGERSNNRLLSAQLPGFRIEAILPPAAVKGPSMCIRRHAARVFTLDEYVAAGVISEKYAKVMADVVDARETVLIAGGTGSGKTTFMNTFLSMMPAEDRLFVIEGVHELQVTSENHVIIECDEEQGVTPRRAVRTAMRYAPKRVIVGELRGPEAYDWLDAANTGHPGSAATIHANSAAKALPRLENLLLMADMGVPYDSLRVAIAETVNWMFYIQRDGAKRTVSQAVRLHGYDRTKGTYDLENF
ncbi:MULTISPECIES: CpaF family protein [unclassified Hydrogenophaga]|uniref:CpaF family protein n=1 Tax=unclassified Hydrogenophaga TaxID=2610897 RepID=UPI00131FCCAC|nr:MULTISPECIES: ATPase, T2SS/T4P/T4SS family [unclassified Hydrogenophaga]MDP3350477.1 ATPase, T2SS/T4P/T4SS family [Hydrogenophaga sp.]QHE78587.1 CpaF family protein [Hydrogenophaga sp. PBL-H3]QHE83012.1 CpaF family protein [Hydrogenophaga sp. PBL-H3]